MKVTRILAALALSSCIAGAAHAQCARLSWGTCGTWTENADWNPAVTSYTLNLSVTGVSQSHVGSDSQIRIKHLEGNSVAVPDAWRFDDFPLGCQSEAGFIPAYNTNAATGCTVFRGPAPSIVTGYAVDVDGSVFIRLVESWNPPATNPVAANRYSMFNVIFDHTNSAAGPSSGGVCGGIDLCENFSLDFAGVLLATGSTLPLGNCDSDPLLPGVLATWNHGCQQPVNAQNSTWGKLKGMYH